MLSLLSQMHRFITLLVLHLLMASTHSEEIRTNRETRSLSAESIQHVLNSLITHSFGSIEPIITFVKTQIKSVVIDIALQAFRFIKTILHDCKVRLIKKLAQFTIADVLHLIFDGVFEFVSDEVSQINTNEFSVNTNEISETSNYNRENYILNYRVPEADGEVFPNPYMLEKLIQSGGK